MTETHPLGQNLTRQIIIGMVAGGIVGGVLSPFDFAWIDTYLTNGAFEVVGKMFVRGLQMLVVPLVFVSLVCGTCSLSDPKRLGRLGGKAILLYLFTTAVAVTTALFFARLFMPGQGSELPDKGEYVAEAAPSLMEVLINLIPRNPVEAFANGEMLQIIVFSILFGLSLTLAGESGQRIKSIFDQLNEVVMSLVTIVMRVAPIGVFALMAGLFADLGLDSLSSLADYFLLVLAVLILHGLVTYSLLVRVLGGLNPLRFLSKMRGAWVFAFTTASSNATIPVTLRTVERRMGAHNSVAAFTVPLGATINMDGTAIMQGIATVFIANMYGVDLTLAQLVTVVLMATLASIGAAGVPGIGLILLAMVLEQVGLPVEGVGLIIGIDRLLDMTRTAVNITGDAAVTCIVARSEGEFDEDVFDDPDAGENVLSPG